MRYEIEVIEKLYVVFKNQKMYAAYETLKQAKEGIKRDKERNGK